MILGKNESFACGELVHFYGQINNALRGFSIMVFL